MAGLKQISTEMEVGHIPSIVMRSWARGSEI